MDVVEAIDAWIDEQIDDLTDDELESILEILDVVAASEVAGVDADAIYAEDIEHLVEETGGSPADRAFTEAVLRASIFHAPFPAAAHLIDEDTDIPDLARDGDALTDQDLDETDLDDADLEDEADSDIPEDPDTDLDLDDASDNATDDSDFEVADLADIEVADLADIDDSDEPDDDLEDHEDASDEDNTDLDDDTDLDDHDTPTDDDDDDDDSDFEVADLADADDSDEPDDGDLDFDFDDHEDQEDADTTDDDVDFGLVDPEDFEPDSDFLDDLQQAHLPDLEADDDVDRDGFAAVAPVELRPFDELGPTFLPEQPTPTARQRRGRTISKVLLPMTMLVGLAVFGYGMVQLVNSLGEDEAPTTAQAIATPETTSRTTAAPTAEPTELPATAAPLDPSAPPPTPTPEPIPPPPIGIRLVTGDIVLATYTGVGVPPEIDLVYDTSDDFEPATDAVWLDQGIGVVDVDGNVLLVDTEARRPKPTVIYEAGDEFDEAVEIAAVSGMLAIRTDNGDVALMPAEGTSDPDDLQLVWDAEIEGSEATDLSAVGDLVAFVLDDGNAQLAATGAEIAVGPLWNADDQPPAFNLAVAREGILLGVGQGAVARYQLGSFEGPRLQSVWDPFSGDEQPAIGYSPAGESTAIILGTGTIVLTDTDSTGRVLWDPVETEIRAFQAAGDTDHVVVLLETGSVVRIPLNPDEFIESIWDITDETLSPAAQVIIGTSKSYVPWGR